MLSARLTVFWPPVKRLTYVLGRYDEYLEDKITKNDMQYLGARDLSRQLVEHGCSIAVKPKGAYAAQDVS